MSAGWHPDPLGRYAQRYHDGSRWTSHVSNVGGVTEEDPMGTAPSAPGESMAFAGRYQHYGSGPERGNALLRFIALIIDSLILFVPLYLIFGGQFDEIVTYQTDRAGEIILESIEWNFPVGAMVGQFLLGAAYNIFMVGQFGRTVGKMALGLSVVRPDGAEVSFGVAAIRHISWLMYAVPLVGIILFIISAVKGFSDPQGRTLHDSVAGTVVARTSSLPGR